MKVIFCIRNQLLMSDDSNNYDGFTNLIDEIGGIDGDIDSEGGYQNGNESVSSFNDVFNEIKNIDDLLYRGTPIVNKKSHNTNDNVGNDNNNNNHRLVLGHRQRAKERFLLAPNAVSDTDLLELLLFLLIPRADTKPIAKKLLEKYQTYRGIMTAKDEEITALGINGKNIKYLCQLLKECCLRYFAQNLKHDGIELSNIKSLVQYCRSIFCDKKDEGFHVLFFNSQLQLIADKPFGINHLTNVSLDTRDIVKTTLDLYAKNIVLTHNHPVASSEPSVYDINCTETIKNFMKTIGVNLIDHIVIANDEYFSFMEHHLI